jgi:hypothetical protein
LVDLTLKLVCYLKAILAYDTKRPHRLHYLILWRVDMMNLIIQLLLMLLLPFSIPQFVLASNNENRYRAIAESFNFAAAGDWNDINNT